MIAWWILPAVTVPLLLLLLLAWRRWYMPIRSVRNGLELLRMQDFSSRLASVGQRDADSIRAIFNRMMDQLKNERLRVLEQNRLLDLLVEASPVGIVMFDFNGHVRQANSAAVTMMGAPLPEGADMAALDSPLAHAVAGMDRGDVRMVRLGDNSIFRCAMLGFLDRGFHRRFLLVDNLADEVRRAEREAYGKVVRMMAHEVRNTVAGSSALMELIETASDPDMADAARSCRERWDSLAHFITAYADMVKLPPPDRRQIDVNALLRAQKPFLESLAAGRDIVVNTDIAPDRWIVSADPVQFEQVIVNVVKNAVESVVCACRGDGEVTLRTVPSEGIVEVIDNGCGISPEVSRHLFIPFYSTKKGGQGIGLTFVREVLSNHSFRFSLATDPATRLTRFVIRMPRG